MFAPEPPVDDLSTSRGVVLSRAATILRSIETQPLTGGSFSLEVYGGTYTLESIGLGAIGTYISDVRENVRTCILFSIERRPTEQVSLSICLCVLFQIDR